jgi:mxaJ protein
MSSGSETSGGGTGTVSNAPSRWREIAVLLIPLVAFGAAAGPAAAAHSTPLRVCADPNNLPFSDSLRAGFENKIAAMVARDLHRPLEYTWWPQHRGFVRNTLRAGLCDLVIGVPSSYELTARTAPYYRSTYVFVTRADRRDSVTSFDDPHLRRMRIGIQMMGDDYANSPAAIALLHRGLGDRIAGYMIYGNYSHAHPTSSLIEAVERGDVDVAVEWGPLAGYFAKQSRVPLRITPVSPQIDLPFTPFVFDIAMGMRRGDTLWRARLDSELVRRHVDIQGILREYGVPLLAVGGSRRARR